MNKELIGLYVHIPFCRKICNYCDFPKRVSSKIVIEKYLEYLIKEIKLRTKNLNFKTIYIGGGTPSFLDCDLLYQLLKAIENNCYSSEVIEWTIETNGEDINENFIKIIKQFPINRISIGIQSFNSKKLKILGRKATYDDIVKKIKLLNENGFNSINIDFMYGVSGETYEDFIEDLDKMMALNTTHISTYSLILEEKTILYNLYQKNKIAIIDENLERKMYDTICEKLSFLNYHHYEISNFAKPSYESYHNFIYWSNERYLGVGLAASSYIGNCRLYNTSNMQTYFDNIDDLKFPIEKEELLTKNDQMWEEIMLGFRKVDGISMLDFKNKFNVDLYQIFPKMKELVNNKILIEDGINIKIAYEFLYVSNYVLNMIR